MQRKTQQAAGYDLTATAGGSVGPGLAVNVPLDLWGKDIPWPKPWGLKGYGFYGKLEMRSKWANSHRLVVLGGVIDSDYMGKVVLMMVNLGLELFEWQAGTGLCQMIVLSYAVLDGDGVDTVRTGGFGSTDTPPNIG